MSAIRLVPVVDDPDTAGFFEAARRNRLAIRICNRCDAPLHMPTAYCRHCGSWDTHWEDTSGLGFVYSWTVVTHQVHPWFPVPYTIALVELDDLVGVRTIGHFDGRIELSVGEPVEVYFETLRLDDGSDVVLPQWKPRVATRLEEQDL